MCLHDASRPRSAAARRRHPARSCGGVGEHNTRMHGRTTRAGTQTRAPCCVRSGLLSGSGQAFQHDNVSSEWMHMIDVNQDEGETMVHRAAEDEVMLFEGARNCRHLFVVEIVEGSIYTCPNWPSF
jgi:hypothetical protein